MLVEFLNFVSGFLGMEIVAITHSFCEILLQLIQSLAQVFQCLASVVFKLLTRAARASILGWILLTETLMRSPIPLLASRAALQSTDQIEDMNLLSVFLK